MPDDVKSLAKTLRLLSGQEFSIATAATLNRVATAANGGQRINIKREFTLRNKFTLGSLMMFKATAKADANKINALVGSKSPYLDDQEVGGTATDRRSGLPADTMPSLRMRKINWGKAASRKKIGGDAFVLRPRLRRPKLTSRFGNKWGNSMAIQAPRRRSFMLKKPGVFVRVGNRIVKIRSVFSHGPVHFKATHWHTDATTKYGRPALISAAYGQELSKGLTKLGAR